MRFNDPDGGAGAIQEIERNLDFPEGYISGNEEQMRYFTPGVNLAQQRAYSIIFGVDGSFQLDDPDHDDLPIITTTIYSGQRGYTFSIDDSSNTIPLSVFRVMVADEHGNYREITPVDITQRAPSNYFDGNDTGGQPNTYDKMGNVILLDPIPNYTEPGGLKVYINRKAVDFTVNDTTKNPGFDSLYHEYVALRPSYQYAFRHSMPNTPDLKREMFEMEEEIREHYKMREKDAPLILIGAPNSAR